MTTFLDTSIVIALLNDAHTNHEWSVAELIRRKVTGPAIVSDIVYCEVSMGMSALDQVNVAISRLGLEKRSSKNEALFRAGRAFLEYRDKNKGPKTGVLPDFIIGAVAEIENAPLMTDNSRVYTKYFPKVTLISPPKRATE